MISSVAEYAQLPEFESLRAEWNDLLTRSDNGSIFATWEWVDACWKYSAPGKQPLVLAARDAEGRLVGLLPLARTSRFRVLHTLEVIGCTQLGYPMGDYGGLMTERGAEIAVWSAMLRYLRKSRWSILDLRNCMAGSPAREEQLTRLYSQSFSGPSWGVRVQSADICRAIRLPSTFEEYLAGLSSNTRQNVRRKLRKLAEDGHTIEQVKPEDEATRNAAMEAFFEFHQDRWETDPSGGGFPDGSVRAMHRYLARSLAASGKLDLRLVRSSEGEIAGVIYNFRHNGVGYYYHLGVNQDARWTPYSLGTCLLADSIAAAIADGCHTFDLLRGDHDYKRHFGGYTTNNLRVIVYRYGWLPKAEEAARKLRRKLKRGAALQLETQP